jgi:Rrf2 family protein
MEHEAENRAGTSLYGAFVEYGLHSLIWMIDPRPKPVSSRDLAEFGGLPPTIVAKIMPRLEKAGLVISSGGINGGYRLARAPEEISVLDVVNAVDGSKSLFDCKDVRRGCVLFGSDPPAWSTVGTCQIHAVMLRAEKSLRKELARTSLRDLAEGFQSPPEFAQGVAEWFDDRAAAREAARIAAVKDSGNRRRSSQG